MALGGTACAVAVALAGCSDGGDGGVCDAAAVAAARAGEEVVLGACEITGPVELAAGVRLRGVAGAVIVAPPGGAGIVAEAGDPATEVTGLTVRVEGVVGVLGRGSGELALRDVDIDAARGVAIAADGVGGLTLQNVTARGPVTSDNASDPSFVRVVAAPPAAGPCPSGETCDCEPGAVRDDATACDASGRWATVTATFGLWVRGGVATLENADVLGFASFGAVFVDADVRWTMGTVRDVLGIGVRQVGGTARLQDVTVVSTLQGLRGDPPYGVAATSARLDSTRLAVRESDRYGMLLLETDGVHEDFAGERNGDAALWAGDVAELTLAGDSTVLCDNAFAGLVVVGSSNVTVSGATIERTQASERNIGMFGAVRIGDGIHLSSNLASLSFSSLVLRDNERAGVVADLGSDMGAGLSFTDITVEGTGAQLGAIGGTSDGAGHLVPGGAGGWDRGITRLGDTAANDAAQTAALDAVTDAAPAGLPRTGGETGVVFPMF
jgi:hypothetical protein